MAPARLAYAFSPATRSVSITKVGSTVANFSAKWATYTISGTVSTGAPVTRATVSLVDSLGTARSGKTDTKGNYKIRTTGIKPPFMLKVPTNSGTLYSVSADYDTTTTVNLTPLTDIILRSWCGTKVTDAATAFGNPVGFPPPAPADVLLLHTALQNTIEPWLQAGGINISGFNAISMPFKADGIGVNRLLGLK